MSGSLLRPLGAGQPMPGGSPGAARIPLRGPTVPQMNRMVAQGPPPTANAMTPPPQARSSGGIGDLPSSFNDSRTTLMQEHGRAKAMFKDATENLRKLDALRKSLDKLSDKQDMVTMEDIVHEAGKLVTHGLDPVALAGVLADAPQEGGGEALGGWVASHAQTAAMGEQQLLVQRDLAKHQVLTSGMHLLMAHANAEAMTGTPVPIGNVPEGNELTLGTEDGGPHEHPTNLQIGQRFMNGRSR